MKRLFSTILCFAFLCGVAWAGPEKRQVIDTLLNAAPTSITGTWNTSDYNKIAFYVDYDETDSGSVVSIAITAHISHDGTNWIAADFSDFDGIAQTSETLTADGSYMGWFDDNIQIPYVRITITATGSSGTELADVDGYITGQK